MKPLPDLSPLYLRTTTPEVTRPLCQWCVATGAVACIAIRCERVGLRWTPDDLPCLCPCHEVKP